MKNILQNKYNRKEFTNFLNQTFGEIDFCDNKEIDFLENNNVSKILKLGTLKIEEPIMLFEVQLKTKIKQSNVLIKNITNYILKENNISKSLIVFDFSKEWKFTYTENKNSLSYVFGKKENYEIARFKEFAKSKKTNKDLLKVFDIKSLTKDFSDNYINHYKDFVEFLTGKRIIKKGGKWVEVKTGNPNHQLIEKFNNDKEARCFVKNMFCQIIILCFLRQKEWVDDKYSVQYFLETADENFQFKLNKIFKNLNTNDSKLFLNIGFFANKEIVFTENLFKSLFKFLSNYCFTVLESTPHNQTIAIDPEMLSQVFERLLEDNKEKGAYYTPKEIVHYMVQESLKEYLKTHFSNENIELLVKEKQTNQFTKEQLKIIDGLLDKVTTCDPAIGSGAFSTGMLSEIFAIKEVIAYSQGFQNWNPAKIKKDIIFNSICGVDIEPGAVETAKLRLCLSVMIDEVQPTPFPNLDYKIFVGDSLINKLENKKIDWSIINDCQLKTIKNIAEKKKTFFYSVNNECLKKEIEGLRETLLKNQFKNNESKENEKYLF